MWADTLTSKLQALLKFGKAALVVINIFVRNAGILSVAVILLLLLYIFRRHWQRRLYEATCAKVHCPDVRDATCCCVSCGCCIMDVWCPTICPQFHPPFGLRLIILKARHLPLDVLNVVSGRESVYVEITAGNNPTKTTSVQNYSKSIFGRRETAVVWNEPVDLIMQPSCTHINFEIRSVHMVGEGYLARQTVSVDSFYDPPGPCSHCTCCGSYPIPKLLKLCNKSCYRWPLIRGAPAKFRDHSNPWQCCNSCKRRRNRRGDDYYSTLTALKAKKIVANDWREFEKLSAEHRGNIEIATEAVLKDKDAFKFVSEELKEDKSLLRIANRVPEPTIVDMEGNSGRLFLYFILCDLNDMKELPEWRPVPEEETPVPEQEIMKTP